MIIHDTAVSPQGVIYLSGIIMIRRDDERVYVNRDGGRCRGERAGGDRRMFYASD